MTNIEMDTFMCVHKRDVSYLFELALRSLLQHFAPRRKVMLISNDLPYLNEAVERWGVREQVTLTSDNDWLSQQEMTLPGWYRQQIIKLRAYEFCDTPNFCNLGADTLLLRPVTAGDMTRDGKPVVYYTRHMPPDKHWLYERIRLANVSRILQVKPRVAGRYVDFINDFFCFNRDDLLSLNGYMHKLNGPSPYYTLLNKMGDKSTNQKKFGEWTLYTTYVLDRLHRSPDVRNSHDDFLRQVHSQRVLAEFAFDSKVVHFVGKDFDRDYIKSQLAPVPARVPHRQPDSVVA